MTTMLLVSKMGSVMDISGGSKDKGAGLISWARHGGANQIWKIEPVKDGYCYIRSVHSGLVVDVTGGSKAVGTKVQMWPANGTDSQLFKFLADGGYWMIESKLSDLCLHVRGGKKDGGEIIMGVYAGTDNELWEKVPASVRAEPEPEASGETYVTMRPALSYDDRGRPHSLLLPLVTSRLHCSFDSNSAHSAQFMTAFLFAGGAGSGGLLGWLGLPTC